MAIPPGRENERREMPLRNFRFGMLNAFLFLRTYSTRLCPPTVTMSATQDRRQGGTKRENFFH